MDVKSVMTKSEAISVIMELLPVVKSAMTKSEAISAIMKLLPVVTDQSVAMVGTDCENLFKIIHDLQNAAQKLCPILHDPASEPL